MNIKKIALMLAILNSSSLMYALDEFKQAIARAEQTGNLEEVLRLLDSFDPQDQTVNQPLMDLYNSPLFQASTGAVSFDEKTLPIFTPAILAQVRVKLIDNKRSPEEAVLHIKIISLDKKMAELGARQKALGAIVRQEGRNYGNLIPELPATSKDFSQEQWAALENIWQAQEVTPTKKEQLKISIEWNRLYSRLQELRRELNNYKD